MERTLTNQDYINMVFLAIKAGDVGCYTTSDLMNKYCLRNTEKLERGDKSKIKKLDDKSYGEYISSLKEEKPIEGYSE